MKNTMLLAVDIGNSHMVIGIFRGDRLHCHWRVRTNRSATVDELAALLHGLFVMRELKLTDLSGMIIASVVPAMGAAWTELGRNYLRTEPLVVGNGLETGLAIRTDNPAEVGADRIVNAIAAYARYRRPLIIVDFGTAITLDCVSAQGDYLGGAIAPGPAISLDALARRTAKLPRVDISLPPPSPIGANTVDAIKSGVLYGYAGLAEGLINRIRMQLEPERPKVIATGGMAELIAPHVPSIETVDPMLTLTGLRILYEQNR